MKEQRWFVIKGFLTLTTSILLFVILSEYGLAEDYKLPDTGQTKCYNNSGEIACPQPGTRFYGQDGSYTINPPSYTKLDAQGSDLPDSATAWVMVRDNVTGLIWEVKTDDGSIHHMFNRYTWQNAQDVFITDLNSHQFGGHADWRMPTIKELTTIIDHGKHQPAINTDYFPNTLFPQSWRPGYWSNTTFANKSDDAWGVSFHSARVSVYLKYDYSDDGNFVRAVRSGNGAAQNSFVDNGNATITDTVTGLMWQKETAKSKMQWEDALSYCENLPLAGYTDWRLPNERELGSLVDYNKYGPSIDTIAFPDTVSEPYWSSTTYSLEPSQACYINFEHGLSGQFDKYHEYGAPYYVRAVRGGPGGSFDDYPYKDFNCPNCVDVCCHVPDKAGDPWGFCIKNCTSYVAHRLNKALGEGKFTNYMDGGHWGNGEHWDENVEKVKGFELVRQPRAGDVAQWNEVAPFCEDPIYCGHVAYVESVNSDGSILVSEYNWPSAYNGNKSCTYGQRTLSAGAPSHFIRANLTPADTADYAKIDDGAAVTEKVQLTNNTELAPTGAIFAKIWNWIKGLRIGLDNTQSSGEKTVKAEQASAATFVFSNVVTEVIAYIADFGGNTSFVAYNNNETLKTINITSSTPEFYTITDVGAITKVVVSSTSAWVGPVTSSINLYVNASGSCGDKKPCYTTIQAALNVGGDGAIIKVGQGTYKEPPEWKTSGTVTISGGWDSTFTSQTGTTSMYAPKATGGGSLKVQPNIRVFAPQ